MESRSDSASSPRTLARHQSRLARAQNRKKGSRRFLSQVFRVAADVHLQVGGLLGIADGVKERKVRLTFLERLDLGLQRIVILAPLSLEEPGHILIAVRILVD